ncbi:MAG: hypothetical protein ACRDRJ_23070 [Streptosporangiaceae bacterium]
MTGDMPAARDMKAVRTAETGEGEPIEVTFSPAEPQLTPGAARAVLAMLLRAGERADHARG